MMALDFRASRSRLERLDLSTYQILHFGTHAIVDLRRPERSGLVLSVVDERGHPIDGFIRAREIFEWRLKADLVVLSGCRTGLGREIRGEGLMALSRGFLAAGASRLVMSLWPVDDKATAELMAHFYRHMLGPERLTPSAALRAAKLEMRRQPRWRARISGPDSYCRETGIRHLLSRCPCDRDKFSALEAVLVQASALSDRRESH